MGVIQAIALDFWAKVEKKDKDECWAWRGAGAGDTQRYGQYSIKGQVILAHRVAWELTYITPIPEGKVVRHACDNPKCVNPNHLELGTQADNIKDAYDRKRRLPSSKHGSDNHFALLSDLDVIRLREIYEKGDVTQDELAAFYGVSQSTVSLIVTGKTWKHLDCAPAHNMIPMDMRGISIKDAKRGMPGSWA